MSDKKIIKISESTRKLIERRSASNLPNRPTEQGMKPSEIKKALYGFVTEAQNSVVSEVNRIVDEANVLFDDEKSARGLHETSHDNPHRVTKEQVGLGSVDNTADKDKPISLKTKQAFEEHNAGTNLDGATTHPELRKLIQDAVVEHNEELAAHNESQDEANSHPYIHGKINTEISDRKKAIEALSSETNEKFAQRVSYSDVQNTLASTETTKPLSAKQGNVLAGKITALSDNVTNNTIKSVAWDSVNYILTITYNTGATQTIDLPMESVVKDASYNSSTKKITFTLINGNTISIDASDLVDTYTADGDTLTLEGNKFKIADAIIARLRAVEQKPGVLPIVQTLDFTAPDSLAERAYTFASDEIDDRNKVVGNIAIVKFTTPNVYGQSLAVGSVLAVSEVEGIKRPYVGNLVYLTGDKGEPGTTGIGIRDIAKTGEDSLGGYIYTITLTDGTIKTFVAPKGTNGVGISTITANGQDANGGNKYLVNLTDGTSYSFTAPKGATGAQGIQGIQGIQGLQGDKGDKGDKGEKGDIGAKIISIELQGQDEAGGNIYLMTFDDGSTQTFVAPKGADGGDELIYTGTEPLTTSSGDVENICTFYYQFNKTPKVGDTFRATVYVDTAGIVIPGTFSVTATAPGQGYYTCKYTSNSTLALGGLSNAPNIVTLFTSKSVGASSSVCMKLDFPVEAYITRTVETSGLTTTQPTLSKIIQTINNYLNKNLLNATQLTYGMTQCAFYPATGFYYTSSKVSPIIGVVAPNGSLSTTIGVIIETGSAAFGAQIITPKGVWIPSLGVHIEP